MSSISKFVNQRSRPHAPPTARPNARASEADIKSMSGKSGPANAPGHHHVHYHPEGDHRQANLHTGRDNASAVPRIQPGLPRQLPTGGGNDEAA
jgi:hypothetical protein